MGVDTSGLQELIITLFSWIHDFDVKDIKTEYIQQLLTTFAPVWNPIWAQIGEILEKYLGF